jgi:hypothetical protein
MGDRQWEKGKAGLGIKGVENSGKSGKGGKTGIEKQLGTRNANRGKEYRDEKAQKAGEENNCLQLVNNFDNLIYNIVVNKGELWTSNNLYSKS